MREAVQKFLNSPAFEKSIKVGLNVAEIQAADGILENLRTRQLNIYGAPDLKGTSALDIGLYLLFIEVLGEDSKNEHLAEMFDVGVLCCKNWTNRLRNEGMCKVVWERPKVPVRGNRGKFEVYNWGIFNKDIYLAFTPYVKLVVDNWKTYNGYQRTGS
jgi:hypothetical protein